MAKHLGRLVHCPVHIGNKADPTGKAQGREAHSTDANSRFVVLFMALLLSQPVHFKIALRSDSKSIRNSIEEGEHRGYVHGLGDLWLGPA